MAMCHYMACVPLRAQDKSAEDYRLDAVHLAIALAHHQVPLPTVCLLACPCLASCCVKIVWNCVSCKPLATSTRVGQAPCDCMGARVTNC